MMLNGFASSLQKVRQAELPLAGLLPAETIQRAVDAEGYRSQATTYTPVATILSFLGQLLAADGCCRMAVTRLIAQAALSNRPKPSADTGGYCKARARLPEQLFWRLTRSVGQQVDRDAPDAWRWQGRRVRIVDGSTLSIPDTDANRSEYPLQRSLQPGLHYPVVRILVIFSLAVGTVLDAAVRPYRGKGTGETGMLRDLANLFSPGDVLLGDRYFSGYWDMAWWQNRGVDLVARNSVSRARDFRRGRRLGADDHLIVWKKTPRPDWIDDMAAATIPPRLVLREVRVRVEQRGFRTREVIIITTLTDPAAYPKEALAQLYRRRWQAELNLRSLKTHLGMDQLSCKTPQMVRKEFATYLLAYNCVRSVGAVAAHHAGNLLPHQVSFQGTRQTINEFFPRLAQARSMPDWTTTLLETAAQQVVGNRPDRIEPYTCKRRPKEWPPPKQKRQAYINRKMQKR